MEERQKGPTDLDCPLWRKPMSEVCHKCPWWMMVERTDKDGYKERHHQCAVPLLTGVATEALQESASTAIEVNKLRNAVVNTGAGLMQLARRGQDIKKIEDGGE